MKALARVRYPHCTQLTRLNVYEGIENADMKFLLILTISTIAFKYSSKCAVLLGEVPYRCKAGPG